MIEKIGGLTFQDGVLVSDFNLDREIEKRGGWDEVTTYIMEHNAFIRCGKENYKEGKAR